MPEPRHLASPPITEAIIDFRVKARSGFRAQAFAALQNQLRNQFPKMEERRHFETMLHVSPGSTQAKTQELGLQGYFFKSDDGKNIAQFRVDGFTFNRLRPYTSLDDILPLAMEMWDVYCGVAKPEVVTRLAVRYINDIPLPPSLRELEDYLRAAPTIPPELPQGLSAFVSRVTIHQAEHRLTANIFQAFQSDITTRQIKVILDIDVYKQHQYAVDESAISNTFQQLRTFKNQIFFNVLTDETLRLFE